MFFLEMRRCELDGIVRFFVEFECWISREDVNR
jgi:hypothetical protein